MADLKKVLKELPYVEEMLFAQYKEATDRQDIKDSYDRYLAVSDAIELLKKQHPKMGRWKYFNIDPETEFPASFWECDVCRKHIYGVGKEINYLYCPFCGAKMENAT